MAQKPEQDIKRALLESLRPRLASEGFKLRVAQKDYVRRRDGYSERFGLSFLALGSHCEIVPPVAMRIDRVEAILNQSSPDDAKYRKDSSTISTAIGD
jgi:hypothetical protein